MPSVSSASSAALTVTVCAVLQLPVVKVSDVGLAVRSASSSAPPRLATATVTFASGTAVSCTVYAAVAPSTTVRRVFERSTALKSSSTSVAVTLATAMPW